MFYCAKINSVTKYSYVDKCNECFICSLSKESIVDVEGMLSAAPEKVVSCSQQDVEIVVTKVQRYSYLYCNNIVLLLCCIVATSIVAALQIVCHCCENCCKN